MEDTLKVKYFSASSVKEFLQCGLKFKYNRIDKLPRDETATHHRWFGTLVHETIYSTLGKAPEGGKDFELYSEPIRKFPTKLFNILWDGKESDDPHVKQISKALGDRPTGQFVPGKTVALGNNVAEPTQMFLEAGWKKEARKMVKNGIELLKSLLVVEVEKKITWELDGYSFVGYVDLLVKDEDGIYSYYDLKTAWNRPTASDMEKDFQFFFYSYALKEILGLDYYPKGYFVHLRSGIPVEFSLVDNLYDYFTATFKRVVRDIEYNMFMPNYNSPLCGYCDFRTQCFGPTADKMLENRRKERFNDYEEDN